MSRILLTDHTNFIVIMFNLAQHFTKQPSYLIAFVVSSFLVIISIPYFLKQQKLYGTYFTFASQSRKGIAVLSSVLLVGLILYGLMPYISPPSNEMAIVLGNTRNSPNPTISPEIENYMTGTLLRHKGEDATDLSAAIKVISAVKHPVVVDLDSSKLKLREIGKNGSNAKRSAALNVRAIEDRLKILTPTDNNANYLEAIFAARDNVNEGANIIVVGSGLADSGDLNFSKSGLLTDESKRQEAIKTIKDKYGRDYLKNYNLIFYGLGDTAAPQESLSSKQKEIVRGIYKEVVRELGGKVEISRKSLAGESVKTEHVVGTTDTGCGNIGLVFDDDNLKFVTNEATFSNEAAAKESLNSIKLIFNKYSTTIQSIQVDGYIAHYSGPDQLSQQRANLVRKVLIDLGIPSEKIIASGKGYGPYEKDSQNRIVKVNIGRNNEQCDN